MDDQVHYSSMYSISSIVKVVRCPMYFYDVVLELNVNCLIVAARASSYKLIHFALRIALTVLHEWKMRLDRSSLLARFRPGCQCSFLSRPKKKRICERLIRTPIARFVI
ncbi:hypothetical protein BKA82DRAFT_499491 [Pisolithus tinctorius]|uniref:Uncharacterized protein n=1 Tax=Pisolithus tinctorius Marx 270 TaxID=870435 RepID=A0A0C3JAX2_PISTI|nr:hypothetical protein BKA82DRAFT_499491 [Pisolithus tinctorius]KIO06218.1 hypothetical protein M404DRAFT_499491 [Pisolithus tinctorius Marx 270]